MTAIQTNDLLEELRSLTPRLRADAIDLDATRAIPTTIIDDLRRFAAPRGRP